MSILAAASVGLIAVGVCWNALFPPASYWSEEQAAEYNAAFNAVHAAQDAHQHGAVPDRDTLSQAHERYLNIRGDLESAQQARSRSSKVATVSGLLMLLAAIVVRRYWPQKEEIDG
jgi:hypothetical protein